MKRVTNSEAGAYVQMRKLFVNSKRSMYSQWIKYEDEEQEGDGIYIVYSYGAHFPMWVWDSATRQWYGNRDKYSRSTTRHQYYTRPDVDQWFDTDTMKKIVWHVGLAGAAASTLEGTT